MNSYRIIDETLKTPIVSVSMLAYNHQNYITQAIEGVLLQKTNFAVQLVIAEDCSPDSTRQIVLDYQKQYPDRIRLVLQNYNVGASKNSLSLFENLDGKYIAICEGDDYWTDPLKLQKQVNFLEDNRSYIATSHNRYTLKNEKLFKEEYGKDIFTQCLVYRNILTAKDYEFLQDVFNADTFLDLILQTYGKIKFLDLYGAVYRLTGEGVYSSLSALEKNVRSIDSYKKMNIFLKSRPINEKNNSLLRDNLANYNGAVITYCKNNENFTFGQKLKFFLQNYEYLNPKRLLLDATKAIFARL